MDSMVCIVFSFVIAQPDLLYFMSDMMQRGEGSGSGLGLCCRVPSKSSNLRGFETPLG